MSQRHRHLSGPTTYQHSALFDQAHTLTHIEPLHADTCKNICPNTKIGPERLQLHLCPGPHLHTGVRMWHIHTDERQEEQREGAEPERAESHRCGRPKSFFLELTSLFWSQTTCVILIFIKIQVVMSDDKHNLPFSIVGFYTIHNRTCVGFLRFIYVVSHTCVIVWSIMGCPGSSRLLWLMNSGLSVLHVPLMGHEITYHLKSASYLMSEHANMCRAKAQTRM